MSIITKPVFIKRKYRNVKFINAIKFRINYKFLIKEKEIKGI
jgi:hypothetical protein